MASEGMQDLTGVSNAIAPGVQPILILEATFFVVLLTLLNIIGVRESSRFNELRGALDVVSESPIVFFGFLFAFNPTMLIHQMTTSWPDAYHAYHLAFSQGQAVHNMGEKQESAAAVG